MKKIFCLIGKSGSGKTEVVKQLENRGYNILQSYTTRKPRHTNEWGHEFCTEQEYQQFNADNNIAAYTYFDGNHYFATKDQLYQNDVYVIDPDGIKDLKKKIKDVEFITIYLRVEPEIRNERMKHRGDSSNRITSRVINDIEKFRKIKCDYKVPNIELEKAVNIIDYIIQQETGANK